MSDLREFDLDGVFDRFARDVSTATTGPGAERAIARSRRQRTGIGAGVVAVLAACGLIFAMLPGGEDGTPPVATDPVAIVPTPLSPAVLDAASSPWVTGWHAGDSPVLIDAPCLDPGGQPDATSAKQFASGRGVGAERIYSEWGSAVDATEIGLKIEEGFASCKDGRMRAIDVPVTGADVTTYAFPDAEDRDGTVWLAVVGDRLGLITIVGAEDPPAAVRQSVAKALVAGLTYGEVRGDR